MIRTIISMACSALVLLTLSCSADNDSTDTSANSDKSTLYSPSPEDVRCTLRHTPSECHEEFCRLNDCGGVDSILDADSCYRKGCASDADCDSAMRCVDAFKIIFKCDLEEHDDGPQCMCGRLGMESYARVCMPAETHLEQSMDPSKWDLSVPFVP